MKTCLRLILTLLACLVLTGCGGDAGSQPSAKHPAKYPYRVTTTIGMITDIVQQVAGDKATVEGIMKGDADPHVFTPSRGDVVMLDQADVIFYNGLMLEGKMGDVLVKMARGGKPIYAVTEMLSDGQYVMSDESDHDDPHVWMDVRGWSLTVRAVAKALSEFDPPNTAFYDANAKAYLAQLDQLDAYAKQVIASIPKSKRVLITAHDAFNYLGRAYDLKVMGVQGLSTESEAGLKRINELVAFLVENKIQAVFVEASVSEKNIQALVEGAASKGHKVEIGGKLYSDSMGAAGTYEGTYIGMIDHNVSTIARALGGTVPEGGFRAMTKK